MSAVMIVEGKHDKERLQKLLPPDFIILCTFGIPTEERLQWLKTTSTDADVYIFTDSDLVGRRIRGILSEEFPDAIHLHTKKEYGGVEKTPEEYLQELLEKNELI